MAQIKRIQLLADYGSILSGDLLNVRRAFEGGDIEIYHPQTGGGVFFLAREVVVVDEELELLKGDKRFWRVSAFALGESDIKTPPMVHRRSHKSATAKKTFDELSNQVGKRFGRVILHQGNLMYGSAKIHLEARA